MFDSQVCVKRNGKRRVKLDHHDFMGIFLGFTATDNSVRCIDVNTGIVKTSHHAVFDKAWYLQVSRPPASQLLYDLALMSEDDLDPFKVPDAINQATYPPCSTAYPELIHMVTPEIQFPLPFRITAEPPSVATRLATLTKEQRWARVQDPYAHTGLNVKIKMQLQ